MTETAEIEDRLALADSEGVLSEDRQNAWDYVANRGMDPFIKKQAHYIFTSGKKMLRLSLEECVSQVNEWVMEAVASFDSERGRYQPTKFSTWCITHCRMRTFELFSRAKRAKSLVTKRARNLLDLTYARSKDPSYEEFKPELSPEAEKTWKAITNHPNMWESGFRAGTNLPSIISRRTGINRREIEALLAEIRDQGPPPGKMVCLGSYRHNANSYEKQVYAR